MVKIRQMVWPGENGLHARRGSFHLVDRVQNLVSSSPYSQQAQTGHLRGELLGSCQLQHTLPLPAQWILLPGLSH